MQALAHDRLDLGVDLLGACPSNTILLRQTICRHLRRSRPEKILNSEYASCFFEPAASPLPAAPFLATKDYSDRLLASGIRTIRRKESNSSTAGSGSIRQTTFIDDYAVGSSRAHDLSFFFMLDLNRTQVRAFGLTGLI
jgi:hypothetical protein